MRELVFNYYQYLTVGGRHCYLSGSWQCCQVSEVSMWVVCWLHVCFFGLAAASVCQLQCQSAFIKDSGSSNVLSVLWCHAALTLQMGTADFKMLVLVYHVLTWCHNPQDTYFYSHPCGNLWFLSGELPIYFGTKLDGWVGDTPASCLGGPRFGSDPRVAVLTEIFHSFTQSLLYKLGKNWSFHEKNCFG
jgi:hypothetical protein